MQDKPMMKCGHAANSVHTDSEGNKTPSCVICCGIRDGWNEVDEFYVVPDGRLARCEYYGSMPRKNECIYGRPYNEPCNCEKPSSTELPFFSRNPDKEHDSFYCGCHSWD